MKDRWTEIEGTIRGPRGPKKGFRTLFKCSDLHFCGNGLSFHISETLSEERGIEAFPAITGTRVVHSFAEKQRGCKPCRKRGVLVIPPSQLEQLFPTN